MKVILALGSGAVIIGAITCAVLLKAGGPPEVTFATAAGGLTSVKSDGVEFLQDGQFRIEDVLLKKPTGETYPGATEGTVEFDREHQTLNVSLPWGGVKIAYAASSGRFGLAITTTNTSDSDTILGVRYVPLSLKFPEKVKEYDGSTPLLAHNVGQLGAVKVSYGSGTLLVVSDDVDKPLMVGFPWASNRPMNTEFPLSVHTNRVKSFPDSYPTVNRPIPPKSSDQFNISLRFGRSTASQEKLLQDVSQKFRETFPSQINWSDHRPIGAIFLTTGGTQGSPTNPRNWFGDPQLNVTTPAGKAEFRQRVLKVADEAIRIMHQMNAQGAITWDIEGQEYAQAVSYIGDPRMIDVLAPEMADVADEYFARFRAAGLRTGICIRPQLLHVSQDNKGTQAPVSDPADLLIKKIAYAKKNWGTTLIYLDSNVNEADPNPLEASVIQKVAAAFPDCLLIPEHANLRYYAYTAPIGELRRGMITTPASTRDVYPKAFSLIYTPDGPLDLYRDSLKAAVKRGDILVYRTWYPDPQNQKVKALYN